MSEAKCCFWFHLKCFLMDVSFLEITGDPQNIAYKKLTNKSSNSLFKGDKDSSIKLIPVLQCQCNKTMTLS